MVSEVKDRLKALRNRINLRAEDIAEIWGMPATSYQEIEDRWSGSYLPLEMVAELVIALQQYGVNPKEVWALADKGHIAVFHEAWTAINDSDKAVAPPIERREFDREWARDEETRRHHERWNPMPALFGLNGDREPCVVKDISPGGACILSDFTNGLAKDAEISLEISAIGRLSATVAHLAGSEIGLKFADSDEGKVAAWLTPMREMRH